jgi:hypothetical protein
VAVASPPCQQMLCDVWLGRKCPSPLDLRGAIGCHLCGPECQLMSGRSPRLYCVSPRKIPSQTPSADRRCRKVLLRKGPFAASIGLPDRCTCLGCLKKCQLIERCPASDLSLVADGGCTASGRSYSRRYRRNRSASLLRPPGVGEGGFPSRQTRQAPAIEGPAASAQQAAATEGPYSSASAGW